MASIINSGETTRMETIHLRIFKSKSTPLNKLRGDLTALVCTPASKLHWVANPQLNLRILGFHAYTSTENKHPGTLQKSAHQPALHRSSPRAVSLWQHLFIFSHRAAAGRQNYPKKSLPYWQAARWSGQGPHCTTHRIGENSWLAAIGWGSAAKVKARHLSSLQQTLNHRGSSPISF